MERKRSADSPSPSCGPRTGSWARCSRPLRRDVRLPAAVVRSSRWAS